MKMKYIFATWAVALLCASCVKDPETTTRPVQKEKEVSTYASFRFQVEGEKTRTTMVSDGSEVSGSIIKNIRLLIFKTGGSNLCEINEVVSEDALMTAKKSKTVLLSSGKKKIFVIANAEGQSRFKNLLDGIAVNNTTLTEFYQKMVDLGEGASGSPMTSFSISAVIGSPELGMVMSNKADGDSEKLLVGGVSEEASKNGLTEATNSFQINVYRAVSKGFLFYRSAATLMTADGRGELDGNQLTYVFKNINRSVFPFQQFVSDEVSSSTNPFPHSPYYNTFDSWPNIDLTNKEKYKEYYYSGYNMQNPLPMYSSDDQINSAPSLYFTENTNFTPRIGNATYALISAQFTPRIEYVVTGFTYSNMNQRFESVEKNASDVRARDLYLLKQPAEGLDAYFFLDPLLAKKAAYCIANSSDEGYPGASYEPAPGVVVKYTQGKCYYRLNLGEGNTSDNTIVYGVKRNTSYRAEVTKFGSIGAPDPEDLTDAPETPLGAITNVTATIRVVDWAIANSGNEL